MTRLLIASLVTGCVATVIFAKEPQVRFAYKDGRTIKVFEEQVPVGVESERARLQSTYLNLAKALADDLSDAELKEEVGRLTEQQAETNEIKERKRLATLLEQRLTEELLFLTQFVEEHPRSEASDVARSIHTALSEQLKIVEAWKAGQLRKAEKAGEVRLLNDPPRTRR